MHDITLNSEEFALLEKKKKNYTCHGLKSKVKALTKHGLLRCRRVKHWDFCSVAVAVGDATAYKSPSVSRRTV